MPIEWISIDDRLPEEDGLYLAYYPSELHKHQIAWFELRFNCFCCYHEDITHWMPLPNPPEGAQLRWMSFKLSNQMSR